MRGNEAVYLKPIVFETAAKVGSMKQVLPWDLVAICVKESACNPEAIRDVPGERAIGAMQIRTDLPGRDEVCAKDLLCSMKWAADHLLGNGYNKDSRNARFNGIWSHNGIVPTRKDDDGNVTRQGNEWYPSVVLGYADRLEQYFYNL